MLKRLSRMLLIAALCVPWATQAQTPTPVSTFPYSCDFEDATENAAWTLVNGTNANTWVVGSAQNNTTGGGNALYVSNDNGTSASYTKTSAMVVYAYRELDLAPGEYTVSFDWKCQGESTFDYILAAVVPSSVTLTAGTALPAGVTNSAMTASGWQNIGPSGQQYIKMNLSTSWTTQNSFFTVAASGTYKLVFLWRNDGSGGTDPGACIDNVVVNTVACPRPTMLTLEELSYDAATLSWYAPDASSFRFYYSTQADFSIDTCTYQTVNDTVVELNGLNTMTTYYWTVVADCGSDGISGTDGIKSFTTLRNCGDGFANINEAVSNGTSSSYMYMAYNYTTYPLGHTGNIFQAEELINLGLEGEGSINGISLHAGSTASVTPLRVYIAKTAKTQFTGASDTVGMLDDMTLVFDDTIRTTAGEWVYIPFDTPFAYAPDSNLMIYYYRPGNPSANGTFYYTSTSPSYSSFYGYRSSTSTSNITFTRTYSRVNTKFDICYEIPSCVRPSDITLVQATENSLELSWTGSADSYIVTYGPAGSDMSSEVAISNSFTLSGLVPGTTYDIEIQSVCGSDTTFAETFTANTLCADINVLPYTMNFEGAETGSTSSADFVNCLVRHNSSTSYYPYVSSSESYCHSGVRGLSWYCPTTAGAYQYLALPPVDTNII